ncbi:MAG TPA: glycosyltransferase, partial [Thermoanaerobaculia bacterium]
MAAALVRGGDAVTVLAPHAAGLPARWQDAGVEVRTFRYAPEGAERLGYGRSLEADERIRGAALAVAPLYALAARRAVRRLLARRRFDLYQAHWLVPNAVAAPGRPRRTPFAVGIHGSDVFLAERPPYRALARRALAQARLVTGCSPELVERVCALGFPAERARVIPYGVDVAAFAPDRERGREWRARLGVPADAPLVLAVGRMATKKGFHVLMQAAPAVLSARPDAHLVLAGAGDRLAELRAAATPWPDRVHFPGAVAHDALPDLFRAADLFVLPAVHDARGNVDGLPNVILEAMASGLPVVASGISGIPLAVEDGRTGLLVPEG